MQLLPFRATFPKLEKIQVPEQFFGTVKQEYHKYFEEGFFNEIAEPSMFIYQITKDGRSFTGVISGVHMEDCLNDRVLKHEETLADKEEKQLQLLLRRKAAVKPVLLAHQPVPVIKNWLEAYKRAELPLMKFTLRGGKEHHSIWCVSAPAQIEELQELFREKVPITYIADGHHRTSTALRLFDQTTDGTEDYDSLFAAFFPIHDIQIQDFNRVVNSLNGHSPAQFMARLSQTFEVEPIDQPAKPRRKFELTMCLRGEWYRLQWKERILLEYASEAVVLDAMLLNHKVMSKLLGIEDVRNDRRVKYIEGPRGIAGVMKEVEKGSDSVAFCLYPVQMEEVIKVADIGQVLPPKSTWFEPRMKNGLLVKRIGKRVGVSAK
ncbi:MAG: DUF1015 family protein [Phaeodactylibacter sp.]|uniref:DUF1015 family protein n=1 Tax=Phaeodactylibacter sp. TaxID=1940289 RepID=UPI0032EEE6CB